MIRFAPLALLMMSACASQKTTEFSAPVGGAILFSDMKDGDAALRLMADVQSMIQTHAEWAPLVLSQGAEPPTGYFFKFKGQCEAKPAIAQTVGRMMTDAAGRPPMCENVAG